MVNSADGSQTLRYEEPSGRHFEGLYYEAAEVARRISAGELETPHRTLDSSLETMATLDMIRRASLRPAFGREAGMAPQFAPSGGVKFFATGCSFIKIM